MEFISAVDALIRNYRAQRSTSSLHAPLYNRVPRICGALVVRRQGASVNLRRHVRVRMAETCRYRGQRNAARKQVRGVRVPERMKAAVLDSSLSNAPDDDL